MQIQPYIFSAVKSSLCLGSNQGHNDFKWLQRVKTALALACLLNYLHDGNSSYMLRNFDPAHIAVDQNFTPILFEFGMLVGEGLDTKINEEEYRVGTCGYIDPFVAECVKWSLKSDVYAFGIVLLSLMSKRARNTHVGARE
nr:probable serine/threonine-protein kinase PBL3 [Nicotiana tomentosiformis]